MPRVFNISTIKFLQSNFNLPYFGGAGGRPLFSSYGGNSRKNLAFEGFEQCATGS